MPGRGQVLVIHERIGAWARQLRPRLADRAVRVVETRSTSDLAESLRKAGGGCPLVLIDLGRRVAAGLEALDEARRTAPDALILVLDEAGNPGVAALARELGATQVAPGPMAPPAVAEWLVRWIALARRRADALGWLGPAQGPAEPEPWNWLTPLLDAPP